MGAGPSCIECGDKITSGKYCNRFVHRKFFVHKLTVYVDLSSPCGATFKSFRRVSTPDLYSLCPGDFFCFANTRSGTSISYIDWPSLYVDIPLVDLRAYDDESTCVTKTDNGKDCRKV